MGNMTGSYGSHYTLWSSIKTNSQNIENNTTNITVQLYLSFDGSSYWATQNNTSTGNIILSWDNSEQINQSYSISQIIFSSGQKKDILLATWTGNIPHDSQGKRTIIVSANWDTQTSRIGMGNVQISSELKQIVRYPNWTTLPSVAGKTLTSITIDRGKVDLASNIYYSLDNRNWIITNSQYTKITGLNYSTQYTIYLQARNQLNGNLRTDISIKGTTYDIARITNAPDITVGNNPTISFTNASKNKIYLYAVAKTYKNNSEQSIPISEVVDVTNLTSFVLPLYHDIIYNTFYDTNVANIRYALRTEQDGIEYLHWIDRIGNIRNSNPIFSNFEYEDVDSKVLSLTGDSGIIVKGYSDVIVRIPENDKAEGQNAAIIQNYKVTIGGESKIINLPETSSESINNINNNIIDVFAIDTRGNSTKVSKNVTMKNYFPPQIKSISAYRENQIGEKITLDFTISFWNENFGAIVNELTNLTYKYKTTDSQEYIDGTTLLSYTVNENIITGSIKLNENFEINDTYNIALYVNDRLNSIITGTIVNAGNPALAIYKNRVAIGQKYDENSNKALQVTGDSLFKGDIQANDLMLPELDNVSLSQKLITETSYINPFHGCYIRKYNGFVEMKIDTLSANTSIGGWEWSSILGTLPETYRPNMQIVSPVFAMSSSSVWLPVTLQIEKTGAVSLRNRSGNSITINKDHFCVYLTFPIGEL